MTTHTMNTMATYKNFTQEDEQYFRSPQYQYTQHHKGGKLIMIACSPQKTVMLEGYQAHLMANIEGKTMHDIMQFSELTQELPVFFTTLAKLQHQGLVVTSSQIENYRQSNPIELVDLTQAKVLKSMSHLPPQAITERPHQGLNPQDSDNTRHKVIIICDTMLDTAVAQAAQLYESTEQPFCLLAVQAEEALLSPVLGTASSVPYSQLHHSLSINNTSALSGGEPLPGALGAASLTPHNILYSLIWAAIERFFTTEADGTLHPQVLRFYKGLFEGAHRVLTNAHVSMPQPLKRGAQAPEIDLSFAPVDDAGRAQSAKETWRSYQHLVSDVTGVVSSLKRLVPEEDELPIHVYGAGHNWALNYGSHDEFVRSLRGRSSGKGTTDISARVSGLAEAIERHSAISDGTEPRLRTSMVQLGEAALNPQDILQFSTTQYANRQYLNRAPDPYHWVPEPFDPEAVIDWMPIWRPAKNQTQWIPAAFSLFMFSHGAAFPGAVCARGQKMIRSDSNGLASGSTPGDAAAQALLELIERDAVAIWWYNKIPRQAMAQNFTDTPFIRGTSKWLHSIGRTLDIIDITSDIGIPVAAAVAPKPGADSDQIILGFGAHPNPTVAATRAVTEALQFMCALPPQFRTTAGADMSGINTSIDDAASQWLKTARLIENQHLTADPNALQVQHVPWNQADPKRIISRLEKSGLPVYLQDLTRPYIGLPVIRAVVPGLRPWWRRLAAGRLYDVPVQCGWLNEPKKESELNPVSMFF